MYTQMQVLNAYIDVSLLRLKFSLTSRKMEIYWHWKAHASGRSMTSAESVV
jgi:hypothetical protein